MGRRTQSTNKTISKLPSRDRAIAWLRAHSWPRFVMSLMLMVTVGTAFLTSVQLHHWAVKPLVRYPLAVLAGWLMFLLLVGVWVMWQRWRHGPSTNTAPRQSSSARNDGSSSIDVFPGRSGGNGSSNVGDQAWGGGGGRFGGGGASDSFAAAPGEADSGEMLSALSSGSSGSSSGGGSSFFDVDIDGDLGGFLFLIGAIIVVALAVFGGVFYVIYNAPIFFAELLIDGGVGTWLYKRANVTHRPDWMATAFKRSLWPVVCLVALFTGLAWVMNHVAPGAMTLGAAFNTFVSTQ
jgi:hypothetical protein